MGRSALWVCALAGILWTLCPLRAFAACTDDEKTDLVLKGWTEHQIVQRCDDPPGKAIAQAQSSPAPTRPAAPNAAAPSRPAAPNAAAGASPPHLKIAIVNINKALNTSEAGERSKKDLLTMKNQKEIDLKAKDAQFRKLVEDTRSNMMLSEDAKAQKEKELRDKESDLRQEVQDAQRELQERERKLTESIFAELRTVIAIIGREEKYDLILEQGASQVILYSSLKFDDLTDEVIQRYNKMQGNKP